MKVNLEYLYDFQKNRYIDHCKFSLPIKDDLTVSDYSDCYILPRRKSINRHFGLGGVLDNCFNEIEESFIFHGSGDHIYFGGKYDFNMAEVEYLKGEYVYLGYAFNHWGHFLVDFCTRLWCLDDLGNRKYIFLVSENESFSFIPQIKRFLELLGIDLNNVILCNHVCKVEKLYIPQQSYQSRKFASKEYIGIFDTIRSNIKPSCSYKKHDKIYFSRKNFQKALGTEVNLDLIDSLFSNNNFEVISPESMSLDDQIACINDSDELAMISGTLIHNLMFLDTKAKKRSIYIINKTYIVNYIALDTLDLKNIPPIMIDCYASKYPVSLGFGPFMLIASNCLHKFIKDYKFNIYDSVYDSDEYLSKVISKYEFMYHRIHYISRHSKFINRNVLSWDYFDNNNLFMWLNNFSKYELLKNQMYKFFGSYNEIAEDWFRRQVISKNKFESIASNKFFLYSVHVSNFGWTNFTFDGTYAGFINTSETIEAFLIKANVALKYKCYYVDLGWQDLCSNDQVCGSCGKRKKIQGIYISCEDINTAIKYRIYDIKNGWSPFFSDGDKIYSKDGFSALEIYFIRNDAN